MAPNDLQGLTGKKNETKSLVDIDEQTRSPLLSPDQARQGVVSGRVVTVLAVSTVLAIVAMILCYVLFV